MKLLVVESPNKAQTLTAALAGSDVAVTATIGSFMDIPKGKMGIVKSGEFFSGEYEVASEKVELLKEIAELVKNATFVYVGTDPDREGEVIASQVIEYFALKPESYSRVYLHSLKRSEVLRTLEGAQGSVNPHLVDSGVSRRIIDRFVGYLLSPMLAQEFEAESKQGNRGIGRVSMKALNILAVREKERTKFEHFKVGRFYASFSDGENVYSAYSVDKYEADDLEWLNAKLFDVKESKEHYISKQDQEKYVYEFPPSALSAMDLVAAGWFLYKFKEKKTMKLSQRLFEKGYITYHRSDSRNFSAAQIEDLIGCANELYGKSNIEQTPRKYSENEFAQEGHGAIGPVDFDIERTPENLEALGVVRDEHGFKGLFRFMTEDEMRIYRLVWLRAHASQFKAALWDRSYVLVRSGGIEWRIDANLLLESGWRDIRGEILKDSVGMDRDEGVRAGQNISSLATNMKLELIDATLSVRDASQPDRYSRGTLVASMSACGVGRPSTIFKYADDLVEKGYIRDTDDNMLEVTDVGMDVNDWCEENVPLFLSNKFAKKHEKRLTKIGDGEITGQEYMREIYDILSEVADAAGYEMPDFGATQKQVEQIQNIAERKNILPGKSLEASSRKAKVFIDNHAENATEGSLGRCPACGEGHIIEKEKFFGCDRYVDGCTFSVWKESTRDFFGRYERVVGEEELRVLTMKLLDGKAALLDGVYDKKKDRNRTVPLMFKEYRPGKWSMGFKYGDDREPAPANQADSQEPAITAPTPEEKFSVTESSPPATHSMGIPQPERNSVTEKPVEKLASEESAVKKLESKEAFVEVCRALVQRDTSDMYFVSAGNEGEALVKELGLRFDRRRYFEIEENIIALVADATPAQIKLLYPVFKTLVSTNIAEHDTADSILGRIRAAHVKETHLHEEEY